MSRNAFILIEKCFLFSRRIQIEGDIDVTYWSYLLIRSIADIFPVSIIVLLNTAVIIATRETSTGRSEIGRQLAWGALAWGKKMAHFQFH